MTFRPTISKHYGFYGKLLQNWSICVNALQAEQEKTDWKASPCLHSSRLPLTADCNSTTAVTKDIGVFIENTGFQHLIL